MKKRSTEAGPPPRVTPATMKFLSDLKKNNSRAWFDANRKRYEAARAEFIHLVDALIASLAHLDPRLLELEPADCVFRINRDTRFSRSPEPYKVHFGAFITDRGRKVDRAGYYFHLQPGGCMIAGGLYMPPAPELRAVRHGILDDAAGLRKIIGKKNFVTAFGKELPGEKLKTAPRDVPKDHPDVDLLRLKSFEIYRNLPDRAVLAPGLIESMAKYSATMHPFITWLNNALDRFH
jgi:uncharacterized protein (TIGR02453 family)